MILVIFKRLLPYQEHWQRIVKHLQEEILKEILDMVVHPVAVIEGMVDLLVTEEMEMVEVELLATEEMVDPITYDLTEDSFRRRVFRLM